MTSLPKLVENYRPWTEAEESTVRERYMIDGPKVLASQLDRSWYAVTYRARRLGVARRLRPWTKEDLLELRSQWGVVNLASIARALGRPRNAVWEKAAIVGLPIGCREDHEFLTASAKRTGYHVASLRRILKWAGVHLRLTMSRPTKAKRHQHCVEPLDVDEAIAKWCAAETPAVAARRLGVVPAVVRRALSRTDLALPPKPGRYRQWQIPADLIDRAMAARAERAA